ncbi:MAG: tripartite tricarboxylate transporter substrate binding protein [Comamonadaceae bacterium]|nr:MAG: tripartite tricarboxylate transporter substrate binding protein [Comamonadaceae bacterium]
MTIRRTFIAALAAPLLAVAASASFAQADDFPSRPVTLVAPFPAGSVTDAVTRVLANALTQSLGKTVIVENKAGAQGTIGAAYVAKAKPDGYTLLVGSSVMFVANSLFKELPYDPVKSFVPVANVGSTAMMFMVPQNSPYKTIADLAAAQGKGGKPLSMAYGSPSGQVAVALFSSVTKSEPIAVAYRGIPQALTDMIGGQVEVAVVDIGSGMAQINGQKARALAISAATRYDGAADVPTLQESYPRASGTLETVIAVLAPAGTPAPVVAKLESALRAAMATTPVKAQFQVLNTKVVPLGSQQLADRIRTDNPRWEDMIKRAGMERQ